MGYMSTRLESSDVENKLVLYSNGGQGQLSSAHRNIWWQTLKRSRKGVNVLQKEVNFVHWLAYLTILQDVGK